MSMDVHLNALKNFHEFANHHATTLNELVHKLVETYPGMTTNSISVYICKNVSNCNMDQIIDSISFLESNGYIQYTYKAGYKAVTAV